MTSKTIQIIKIVCLRLNPKYTIGGNGSNNLTDDVGLIFLQVNLAQTRN
jgi:hypothetical protein